MALLCLLLEAACDLAQPAIMAGIVDTGLSNIFPDYQTDQ